MLETAQTSGQRAGRGGCRGRRRLRPPSSVLRIPSSSPTVESVIEAILFATDEPLPESKLAGIVETTAKQVRESIESLNAKYEANHNAFRIEQIAGGYQMLTLPIYNSWLKKMLRVRSDNKLSPAAMETLAIIAYKQPIIRADIEADPRRGRRRGHSQPDVQGPRQDRRPGRDPRPSHALRHDEEVPRSLRPQLVKDLPKAEDLKNPDRG